MRTTGNNILLTALKMCTSRTGRAACQPEQLHRMHRSHLRQAPRDVDTPRLLLLECYDPLRLQLFEARAETPYIARTRYGL